MNIFLMLKSILKSMLLNKMRTFLTVLGVVIGISSVIIVFSAGAGIEGLIVGQVESFGTDIINTEIKVPSGKKGMGSEASSGSSIAMGVQITTLNQEDMDDIKKLPNVIDIYGSVMTQEKITHGNESRKALILGTNKSYIDIDKSEIEFGRFFTEEENKSLSKVVVLGKKIKEKLFGDSDALNKTIKFHNSKYRVVGVMEERGAMMTMDFDDFAYVPLKTLQKRVLGIDHVLYSIAQIKDLDAAEETAEEMRSLLRENHDISPSYDENGKIELNKDDFRVTTMAEMMDMLGIVTTAITWLLLAIVAISLVVGGVGIMNIMYVVVSERTSEIGLRKAVGAKYSDIMKQFLLESIIITIIGGILGILLGVSISYLIAIVATGQGMDWRFSIPLESYFVSLGFSSFFGILFGLYPAKKAASLNPIDALRKE
jgi:putative ABC transport system permease protein